MEGQEKINRRLYQEMVGEGGENKMNKKIKPNKGFISKLQDAWDDFDIFFRIEHPGITYAITISLSALTLFVSIVALVMK